MTIEEILKESTIKKAIITKQFLEDNEYLIGCVITKFEINEYDEITDIIIYKDGKYYNMSAGDGYYIIDEIV